MNIMLVEEDDDNRELIAGGLIQDGHRVVTCVTAAEAQQKLQGEERFGTLVVNYTDGFELLCWVRSEKKLRDMKVVVMIADMKEYAMMNRKVRDLGARGLQKPCRLLELREALRPH